MASNDDWCADKLSRLLQEELRISTLNEMKEYLSTLPQSEAKIIANQIDLPLVFDCLNDSNSEQIDLACEVLTLCFNNLNLRGRTPRFDVELERSLNHPHQGVKLMALRELERLVNIDQVFFDLCRKPSLISSIVRCIGHDDIAVAKKALDIIYVIGRHAFGIKILVASDVIEVIREIMDYNEVVRLRLYELAIDLSKESDGNLSIINTTGLLNKMFSEIDNTDILLRMNIVELLSKLSATNHGLAFLEENGIILKLFSIIEKEDDPISYRLCEPGILKFFATVAHSKPLEILSKYPQVFDKIFSNLESNDLTIIVVSLDTIGTIGLTNEGKIALHSTGNKMTFAAKAIAALISCLPDDARLTALHCFENLMRVKEKNNEVMQITRKWYTFLGRNAMETIARYARNPFTEIKMAGLGILHALAEQQWGQEEIRNTPGLIEFLLDRHVEVVKECKEMKYEVVKALSRSTTLDHSILNRLQEFVREGPFYVEAVTEIAFEGND